MKSIIVIAMVALLQSKGEQRFRALDKNNDNQLSYSEASEWFMLGMDADRNGQITVAEATAWAKQNRREQRESTKVSKAFVLAKDVAYVEEPENTKEQSLDIYGKKSSEKQPVIIYIHGGAWTIGDKSNGLGTKVPWIANHDWLFVSINYRLAPKVQHPVLIEDVAAAVAWVHEYIDEYGGDPEKIVVMGHSAGAHLAALVSTDKRKLEAHKKPLSIIKAAVLLDGAGYDIPSLLSDPFLPKTSMETYTRWASDNPDIWKDASPITHIEKDIGTPEFLILHTSRKRAIEQSKQLAKVLQSNGVQVKVVPCLNDTHASINANVGAKGHICTTSIEKVMSSVEGK
jgi:acetyl esterase/lipase